ncbi:hypothetical protein CMK18_15840 [Candidatus Poribacteria bacterium]|nr:hypothetical protein [Candidatus Poribacteria bacterium]
MDQFIPVAINCSYTQNLSDKSDEFFCLVAEQGHYGGQTLPTNTRQGLYTCTTNGELLASVNTRDGSRVVQMMQQALQKWPQVAKKSSPDHYHYTDNWYGSFPENATALNLYVRDLPHQSNQVNTDWNLDHIWLTADEMRELIPENLLTGHIYSFPESLSRRIAKLHLVDIVRGESPRWKNDDLKRVEMKLRVQQVTTDEVDLYLEGLVENEAAPSYNINPFSKQKVDMPRGIKLELQGYLKYNQSTKKIDRFDVTASGLRWGATTYNARFDDLGPTPIGFALELADDSQVGRTPPQAISSNYFDSF